ncbi:response regulator [Fundidesulfovibrio soli]|uniref:response regulator n=1 Tax=Fundidesulfovibrio soli TaxID=2922716 RepID=UPI001FB01E9B|nr:response regulator [Fundidesulfovibrio soli]
MKRNIIFVDDDPQLLKSLSRMLWSYRGRWEMSFVESGAQALEALDRQRFDVVVADMRMPGMDGQQLLSHVRTQYPWILRVILSGDSDRESIMRAVPVSHQFLTKPVTAELLAGVIERGCGLRDMVLSQEIRTIIGGIDTLPALPEVYHRLLEELDKDSTGTEALASIIGKDIALSADVLKLVNSSFFSPRMHVSSVAQAVTLLGTETIKGLVLGVQLFKTFDTTKFPNFRFDTLWGHCLQTARLARLIAELEDQSPAIQDDCFIAGLLHDLGKFVLAQYLPLRYGRTVALSREDNASICEAEQRCLSTTHAQAGAYLLGLWGIADNVIEAVAFHHEPARCCAPGFGPLTAVHAANAIQHDLVRLSPNFAEHPMDMDYIAGHGLAERIPFWRERCREALEQAGE